MEKRMFRKGMKLVSLLSAVAIIITITLVIKHRKNKEDL